MTSAIYVGGLDIGATKIAAAVSDQAGRVLSQSQEPLRLEGGRFAAWRDGTAYDGVAAQAVRVLEDAMRAADIERLKAVGIGSAGPLAGGAIVNSTNIKPPSVPPELPIAPLYLPLTEPIGHHFDASVLLENDANAAALGELYYGVGKEAANKAELNLVYVTLSTGLGAGVWTDGRLLRGKDGNAAEIGHFVVQKGGLRCGCGNIGCAEAYCSGRGMVENARARILDERLPLSLPILRLAEAAALEMGKDITDRAQLLEFIDPPKIFRASREEDPVAREVVQEAVFYGGIVLADIANAYDPEMISVGGGIGVNQPQLVEAMEAEMLHLLNVRPPQVRVTPLGERAVTCGAIVLAKRSVRQG